jgi:hypothetical protein
MPDDDEEFILEEMGVTIRAARIDARTDSGSEWQADASHWRVNIRRNGESFDIEYSQGSAFQGATPNDTDVFNSLLLDTSEIDGTDFEEWCGNYGYDTDSRRAERMFNACKKTYENMRRLFSDGDLDELRELFADH